MSILFSYPGQVNWETGKPFHKMNHSLTPFLQTIGYKLENENENGVVLPPISKSGTHRNWSTVEEKESKVLR